MSGTVLDPIPARKLWTPDGTILSLDDIDLGFLLARDPALAKVIGVDPGSLGGGGGASGLEWLQSVAPGNVANFSLSGLDGDTDGIYEIIAACGTDYNGGGGGLSWLLMQPNADGSTLYDLERVYAGGGTYGDFGGSAGPTYTAMYVGLMPGEVSGGASALIRITLYARKGDGGWSPRRLALSDSYLYSAEHSLVHAGTVWHENATNITSLKFTPSDGSNFHANSVFHLFRRNIP